MKEIKNIALAFFCLCSVFLSSQNTDSRLKLADSLLDAKQYDAALKLSLQLVETYPKDAEVYIQLAYCYNNLKQDQKCLDAVDKALTLNKDKDIKYALYYLKADTYSRMQREDEAMKYCEKFLDQNPNDCYGLDLRGWLYYLNSNYDKAIADFEHAMQDTAIDSSEKTYALTMLGSCYLQKENLQKAKMYSGLAIVGDKDDYEVILLSANILFHEKNFGDALKLYQQLHSKDTSDYSILSDVAGCYFYLKEYDRAISTYKMYLSKYPESSDVFNMIAWTLFIQKKYNEGLPYANKAIVQDPANSDAYDTRGCILYKKGDYVTAISNFDSSLKIDKESTNSYYFRGLCFLKINKKADACSDFEKVLADKSYELKEGEIPVEALIGTNCKK